jgi:acetyl-CoA carboxylase biotin carboxyl carrier protein
LDKEILDLIEFISRSNFVEFELEREGFRIRLVKSGSRNSVSGNASSSPEVPLADAESPGVLAPAPPAAPALPARGFHEIKSPLVGTFYRAPSPEAPAFTDLGKTVRAGQVLCIVEAMKLMNEIESDTDGVMEEILVSNGQPVEYGEILFRIRPTALDS